MNFSQEKIPENISEEGPIPEGCSHDATPEEIEKIEDMEEFYSKHPYEQK